MVSQPGELVVKVNRFIVYLAMPALILLKVPALQLSSDMMVPASVAWAWLAIGVSIVLLLSRAFNWPRSIEGAMLILVTMGNTSFLGFPMVLAFFDDAVLTYAIFFDQLGGFLILSTFGLIVISLYAAPEEGQVAQVKVSDIIRKVFTFPPFIALLIAVFLPVDSFIDSMSSVLEVVAKLLMPAALFVLGVQFQAALLPQHRLPLLLALALKMVLAPAMAWLMLLAIGSSGDVRTASIFEAAMPSMITPGLMAIHAGIAPRFIATVLGYSTIFAFASLPIVAWLLRL